MLRYIEDDKIKEEEDNGVGNNILKWKMILKIMILRRRIGLQIFFFGNEKCLDIFGIIWIIKTKENFVLKI
jgi:hypothetical protein